MLAEGVLRLLRVISGATASLLILEDLHWADTETLAVVEYLADNFSTERMLCLATVRTGEHSEAGRLVARLAARRGATVVELSALGEANAVEMAAACLRTLHLPERVRQLVTQSADGIPFLVEEILATLASAGVLRTESGSWFIDESDTPVLPVSFVQTVQARMVALGDDGRSVLEAGALLGRRFDWRLLPSVTPAFPSAPSSPAASALS